MNAEEIVDFREGRCFAIVRHPFYKDSNKINDGWYESMSDLAKRLCAQEELSLSNAEVTIVSSSAPRAYAPGVILYSALNELLPKRVCLSPTIDSLWMDSYHDGDGESALISLGEHLETTCCVIITHLDMVHWMFKLISKGHKIEYPISHNPRYAEGVFLSFLGEEPSARHL